MMCLVFGLVKLLKMNYIRLLRMWCNLVMISRWFSMLKVKVLKLLFFSMSWLRLLMFCCSGG